MRRLFRRSDARRGWVDAVTRIEQITKVMDELAACRGDACLGALIGELDWLAELHRLLYGGDL